jgi:hypothetical protein
MLNRDKLRLAVAKKIADLNLDAILYPLQKILVASVTVEDQSERNGTLSNGTGFPAVTFPSGFSAPTASAPLGVPVGAESSSVTPTPSSRPARFASCRKAHHRFRTSHSRAEPALAHPAKWSDMRQVMDCTHVSASGSGGRRHASCCLADCGGANPTRPFDRRQRTRGPPQRAGGASVTVAAAPIRYAWASRTRSLRAVQIRDASSRGAKSSHEMRLDDGALLGATEEIERAGDQDLKLGGAAEKVHHICRKAVHLG